MRNECVLMSQAQFLILVKVLTVQSLKKSSITPKSELKNIIRDEENTYLLVIYKSILTWLAEPKNGLTIKLADEAKKVLAMHNNHLILSHFLILQKLAFSEKKVLSLLVKNL